MEADNNPINTKNETNKYYLKNCKKKKLLKNNTLPIPTAAQIGGRTRYSAEEAAAAEDAAVRGCRKRWCLRFSLCQNVKMKGKIEIYIDIIIVGGAPPAIIGLGGFRQEWSLPADSTGNKFEETETVFPIQHIAGGL